MKPFDTLVAEVWHDLQTVIPGEFKSKISQIRFIVEDEPSELLLSEFEPGELEDPENLFGLHVGTPITDETLTNPPIFPVRVYLFRKALLSLIEPDDPRGEDLLREEIAITLLHEIGHFFGLDEDDLTRLGFD